MPSPGIRYRIDSVHRLTTLPLTCALVLLGLAACDAQDSDPQQASADVSAARAKNVILVVADTLRANRLGCYGYERDTSPAIDALAEEGTLYESCHSQACWTLPSMISIMAGMPVTKRETALPPGPVLAETLQAEGLATAAFLANITVGVDRGFERGFDHFGEVSNLSAVEVVDAFAAWHESWRAGAEEGAPFFAWVHFIDPHHPYEPGPQDDIFDELDPHREALEPRWRTEAERVLELSPDLPGLGVREAVESMQSASNRYDGEVRAVDRGVERLLEILRARGELDDTLIVFCSDHGEMLYEQENFPYLVQDRIEQEGGLPDGVMDLFGAGHRPWYYEDLWHTPLIFSGPGFEGGGRRGGLAANLDLYPTILEALQIERPPFLRGESLLGAREPTREHVFAYGHYTTVVLDRSRRKLVVNMQKLFLVEPKADAPLQLFDLDSDPGERENLAYTDAESTAELLGVIEAWRVENERQVIDTTSEAALRAMNKMGYFNDLEDDEDE